MTRDWGVIYQVDDESVIYQAQIDDVTFVAHV